MTTTADPDRAEIPTVSFDTEPSSYRHWKLDVDRARSRTLRLDIDEAGGIVPGYELEDELATTSASTSSSTTPRSGCASSTRACGRSC